MSNSTLATFQEKDKTQYTNELIFIPGEFRLSNMESLPYFSVVMPLQDLVNQIKLVEDLPQEAVLDWSLEELFQRDISWKRVNTELVDRYLKDQSKLSFFNSLTIALLPIKVSPKRGLTIEKYYSNPDPDSVPTGRGDGWERKDVGHICVEYLNNGGIGVIRWHTDRIFPVAIDGQHRLAALKKYYENRKKNFTSDSPELKTKISLILLILDEQVGFKREPKKSLIGTLREIFIDLNKNARTVPKSRRILLEDQNIQSLCVRTLLAEKAKQYTGNELPLSIVTWREDEAKFDSGHSMTSVLNLDEIVNYCFDRTSIDKIDPLDRRQIKKYVDIILTKLDLEHKMAKSINNRIDLCVSRADPFSFEDTHLESIEEAFRKQWTPHIIRIFNEFTPYKNYIDTAKEIGAIDGELSDFLLLPIEKRHDFEERKKDDLDFNPDTIIKEPLKRLGNLKTNKWAFQVVFQKGLFINLFELDPQKNSLFDLCSFDTRTDFLTWWISQVNTLNDQGVFSLHWKEEKGKPDLWVGIANNLGAGSIQYTLTAARRISSFITICMYYNIVRDKQQIDARIFADSLIANSETTPPIVKNAFKLIREGLVSFIKQKANTNADEIEDDKELEKRLKQELVKRLKAIHV